MKNTILFFKTVNRILYYFSLNIFSVYSCIYWKNVKFECLPNLDLGRNYILWG